MGIQESQILNNTLMGAARLKPFIEVMEEYGKVIEVFINTVWIM